MRQMSWTSPGGCYVKKLIYCDWIDDVEIYIFGGSSEK